MALHQLGEGLAKRPGLKAKPRGGESKTQVGQGHVLTRKPPMSAAKTCWYPRSPGELYIVSTIAARSKRPLPKTSQ